MSGKYKLGPTKHCYQCTGDAIDNKITDKTTTV